MRDHAFKLYKKSFKTNIGKYAFANRVVDVWNCLPVDVVSCNTVRSFKIKVDCLFKDVWGLIKVLGVFLSLFGCLPYIACFKICGSYHAKSR